MVSSGAMVNFVLVNKYINVPKVTLMFVKEVVSRTDNRTL